MDIRLTLMDDDKEKLVDEILDLRQKVKALEGEKNTLQKEIESLKKKVPVKSDKPDFTKTSKSATGKPPWLWGRKKGHPGTTRPKPTVVHHTVEQTLASCPDCGNGLGTPVGVVEHRQEDIVPAHVEVTLFKRSRYWCSCCHKVLTSPYAHGQIPHGYLGPQALATMVWLKYHAALPANKIQAILHDLAGLSVSRGAITQALQRLAHHLRLESDHILKKIQEAPYKHVDETGWTINGVTHWLWSLVNARWAYNTIDKSRGSKVPKELLGHPFKGVVVSDFYSAYNKIQGTKQKCLVHLQRDIRNARDAYPPGEGPPDDFNEPNKTLQRLLADAHRLAEHRDHFSPQVFARRVRRLKNRLFHFGTGVYSLKFWQRISGRILKHHQSLLTFLDHPGLSSNNNAAERSIKPHVIIRNRSFQNRTLAGARAHGILSSLVQTLILQNKQPVPEIARAFLAHSHGTNRQILF